MSDMLADAGMLMLIGMLTVFTFLVVLTFCVKALTRLTADPTPDNSSSVQSDSSATAASAQPNAAQMAAIATAVAKYRQARHSS